jgi:hypothetical protein
MCGKNNGYYLDDITESRTTEIRELGLGIIKLRKNILPHFYKWQGTQDILTQILYTIVCGKWSLWGTKVRRFWGWSLDVNCWSSRSLAGFSIGVVEWWHSGNRERCVISDFCRDADEIRNKKAFLLALIDLEVGTDRLFRNVGTELPLNTA